MSAAYSVSLFTDWSGATVGQAWLKNRTDQAALPAGFPEFFSGTPATQARHPLPGVSGSNCTQQLGIPGPWSDRLAALPDGIHAQQGRGAAERIPDPAGARRGGHPHRCAGLSGVVTPCSWSGKSAPSRQTSCGSAPTTARDGIGLHFTWRQDEPAVSAILPRLEAELAPFAARPHWGKLFHGGAASIAPLYPALCRLHRAGRPAGSGRKIPQRVPGPHGVRPLIVSR